MRTRKRPLAQEPIEVPAPSDLTASVFRAGHRQVAVLHWNVALGAVPASLSPAERDVVDCAMSGLSNAAIAAQRGTSPRTVANQLARVFQKLGVRSRHELHAAALRRKSEA